MLTERLSPGSGGYVTKERTRHSGCSRSFTGPGDSITGLAPRVDALGPVFKAGLSNSSRGAAPLGLCAAERSLGNKASGLQPIRNFTCILKRLWERSDI